MITVCGAKPIVQINNHSSTAIIVVIIIARDAAGCLH